MTAYEIADAIEGSDAAAILTDRPYRSFCSGSDTLEKLGLWTGDCEVSDLGRDVRQILINRIRALHLAE